MTDVYRVHRVLDVASKKPKKLRDLVKDNVPDVELVCASARLMEAVENLKR